MPPSSNSNSDGMCKLSLVTPGLVLAFALSTSEAYHVHRPSNVRTPTTKIFAGTLSLERTAQREVTQFQEWAGQCGVQPEYGFALVEEIVEENEDWRAITATGAPQGSRVLFVPGQMILSAGRISQEYGDYVGASFQILERKGGLQQFYPHFFLFLRVLVEYEQGQNSPYYPWIASLPRKWNTAVSMDDFCLSCLPPFIKSLCQKERAQLADFKEALQAFEYVSPESKRNDDLLRFAYNVVFTRAFPVMTDYGEDYQIIPVADMLNHGDPANVALYYDPNSGVQVVTMQDVSPGETLTLSYGQAGNPSRFLATYGFLNEAPATYCKILIPNSSRELVDVGYDTNKLLFNTATGDVDPAVWDVMLYSRLERKPDLENDRRAFYEAHMTGNEATKAAIQRKYLKETRNALIRHVNNILIEVFELSIKMNAYDSSQHPRLPLIKKHNDMVYTTFQKVRANLEKMAV